MKGIFFYDTRVLQVHEFYRISTTFWFVTIPSARWLLRTFNQFKKQFRVLFPAVYTHVNVRNFLTTLPGQSTGMHLGFFLNFSSFFRFSPTLFYFKCGFHGVCPAFSCAQNGPYTPNIPSGTWHAGSTARSALIRSRFEKMCLLGRNLANCTGGEIRGFARVNRVTSASLRTPLSLFYKNTTLKRSDTPGDHTTRGRCANPRAARAFRTSSAARQLQG